MYSCSNNEVHIWQNSLYVEDIDYNILNKDEIAYAEKYPTADQKRKYYYTRVLLKQILAQYLDIEPNLVKFVYSSSGKPYLCSSKPLYFNLSHTPEQFCLAIGTTDEIGIDIESKPKTHTMNELIDYYLTDHEKDAISSQSADDIDRELQLLRIWTQKEAITKALGHTLESSLKHINVDNCDATNFVFNYDDTKVYVSEFLNHEGTVGTIATKFPIENIKLFNSYSQGYFSKTRKKA